MAQLFHRSFNTISRASIVFVLFTIIALTTAGALAYRSGWYTRQRVAIAQPVPFSHEHHVSGLGIDCRFCHTSVEESSFAGIPPTETCMICHSQIWTNASALEPIRESFRSGKPLRWNRVHDLPDFVYFDHSIHVRKGVGCAECHGAVDRMPITWQEKSMHMRWCLDCHNDVHDRIRPQSEVLNLHWQKPKNFSGAQLVHDFNVNTNQLRDCSVCHR